MGLLFAGAAAAQPAVLASAATADSKVYVTGVEPARAPPAELRVSFREEGTSSDYVTRNGGASVRGQADVDCAASAFQLVSFDLFTDHELAGRTVISIGQRPGWRTAPPRTLMGEVVALACHARRPGGPPPPAAPAPKGRVAVAGPPAPGLARSPAAPAPTSVAVTSPLPPLGSAALTPSGPFWLQLAAADTAAGARKIADAFAKAIPQLAGSAGPRITPTKVKGREVFRVLVGGFATANAANDACMNASAQGWTCFVRRL